MHLPSRAVQRTRQENGEQTLDTARPQRHCHHSRVALPLPPRPGTSVRRARRPYHSTRRNSSKNPGKTKSSLAMAQRRPKSTIPGMAKARRLASGQPAARQSLLSVRHPPGSTARLTATPRRRTRGRGRGRMRTLRPSQAHATGPSAPVQIR